LFASVSLAGAWDHVAQRLSALPLHTRILLGLATTVFLIELLLRRVAPDSRFYAGWTRVFQAIGKFWTAVILSIVYFLSVAVVSAVMKLRRQDLLDRSLRPEPTFWRAHDPNPLGPRAAARHQF
jgi:hypothetical protein